jgi:hypothetical protein
MRLLFTQVITRICERERLPEIPSWPAQVIRTINTDKRVREWRLSRITTERGGSGATVTLRGAPPGPSAAGSSHLGIFGPGRVPEGLFARSLHWLMTGLRATEAGSEAYLAAAERHERGNHAV